MLNKILILIAVLLVGGVSYLGWLFFFSDASTPAEQPTGGFGTGGTQTVGVTPTTPNTSGTPSPSGTTAVQQKVFRVSNGPVVSATVVQYTLPTTTVARYVQQSNGHVFDLVLDSSGALPKAVSNTTIPGIARALWTKLGEGVILQYLDDNTVKTVSLTFPPRQATSTQAVTIKFLPDGIADIAVSPNGASVAYILRTQTGVRGYIASSDGSGSRELFTLPLKEVALVWPAQQTLLAHSKPAYGISGIAFSISASSGAVVPLLHAAGLSVTADPSNTYTIYQTTAGTQPSTYARSSGGQVSSLSFNPSPERCVWSRVATSTLYCAAPLEYVTPAYLDAWHMGTANADEAVLSYTFPGANNSIIAVPGGDDGGVSSTIDMLSVASDGKYLLFVRRGDRSLWGIRL